MPEIRATAQYDTLVAAALLATVGGLIDSVVYLKHGHVFANAMTGNVILLGISAMSHDWWQVARHIAPLVAFLGGVAASRLLRILPGPRAALSVLALEIIVLFVAGLLPTSFPNIAFTATISFVSAFQVSTFRRVGRFSYNSTFVTGNLRDLAEGFVSHFVDADPDARRQDFAQVRKLGIICSCFLLGAILGAWATTTHYANHALWLTEPLLLIVGGRVLFHMKQQSE
jgi:uncharacterized membrane protein YoaK (UPF0700 family)